MFIHVNLEVMKYVLKQNKEDKGILCDKVTIDGFDYYESIIKTHSKKGDYSIEFLLYDDDLYVKKHEISGNKIKKIIATNNPNIDLPEVKEMSDYLAKELNKQSFDDYGNPEWDEGKLFHRQMGFIDGHNKSQETHSNSDEDMCNFLEFCEQGYYPIYEKEGRKVNQWGVTGEDFSTTKLTREELLQLWKEQQPKIVYYVPA